MSVKDTSWSFVKTDKVLKAEREKLKSHTLHSQSEKIVMVINKHKSQKTEKCQKESKSKVHMSEKTVVIDKEKSEVKITGDQVILEKDNHQNYRSVKIVTVSDKQKSQSLKCDRTAPPSSAGKPRWWHFANNRKKWKSSVLKKLKGSMASTSSTKETTWCLVDRNGTYYKLPQSMIFLGREECDIALKSRSVDKRHAVISFDHYENKFKVKDLSSLNGTFVNESRIPEQDYVNLDHMDTIRFGYDQSSFWRDEFFPTGVDDPMVYRIERVDESPQMERVEDLLTKTDKIPVWAKREETVPVPHKAECRGCVAEQCIKHTCNSEPQKEHLHPDPSPLPPETGYSNSPGNYGSWPRSRHMKDIQMKPNDRSYQYTTYPDQDRNVSPYHDVHNIPITAATYLQRYNADPGYTSQQLGFLPHLQQPVYQNIPTTISLPAAQIPRPSDYVNYNVTRLDDMPPNTIYRDMNDPQFTQYPVREIRPDKPAHTHTTEELSNRPYNGTAYPKSVDVRDIKDLPSVLLPDNQKKGSNASTPMTPDSIGGGRQDRRRSIPENEGATACTDASPDPCKEMDQTLAVGEGEGLGTVKKGTPLYGQPSWWGEDDADDYKYPHTASLKGKSPESGNAERPSSLKLDTDQSPSPPSKQTDSGIEQSTDRSKPADMSSMAFTIDLDDEADGSSKKLGMRESLSKFMPSKIRKSFKDRTVKTQRSRDKGSEGDQDLEKLEELSEANRSDKKGLKRSGYLSDQQSTASEEDVSGVCRSEATVKDKRLKVTKSMSMKPPKTASPRQAKTKPVPKPKTKVAKPADKPAETVPEPVDHMLNGKTTETSAKTTESTANQPTEYVMYKEAKQFDVTPLASDAQKASKGSGKDSKKVQKKGTETDNTDNVSDAGTYTIESDSKPVEVEQARQEIDAVFGVSGSENLSRPVVNDETRGLDDTDVSDENILDDDLGKLERDRAKVVVDVGDSLDANLGSAVDEKFEEEEKENMPVNCHDEEGRKKAFDTDGSEPKWVRQWSSKDNQRPSSPVVDGISATVIVTDSDKEGGPQKPTSLIDTRTFTRKPKGTGRKLPSTPTGASPRLGDTSEPTTPLRTSDDVDKSKLFAFSQSEPNTPSIYTAEWLQVTCTNLTAASRTSNQVGEKQIEKSAKESFNSQMSLEKASASWSKEVEQRLTHQGKGPESAEYKTGQDKTLTNLSRDGERRSQDRQIYRETEFRRQLPEAVGIQRSVSPKSKSHVISDEERTSCTEPIDEALRLDLEEEAGRSLDTEILLKDTKDVMDMLEARVQARRSPSGRKKSQDNSESESDLSSCAGVKRTKIMSRSVDFELGPKKSFQLSPKPTRKSKSDKRGEMSVKEKVLLHLSSSPRMSDYKRGSLPGNIDPACMPPYRESDTISESGSVVSGRSDTSETSDASGFRRSGSKGKGPMSMTRPNRAFALRRARLGSMEDLQTQHTEPSVKPSVSKRTPSSAGSSAVRKTSVGAPKDRNKARPTSTSTSRSDVSLGTKIVQKSRENSRSESFARTDGGRHSLRSGRSNSTNTQDTDLKALKSKLNASRSTTSLVISGRSATSGSTSQPSSRSSSPKSAEKTAWERRKRYDPRRAVAEAKAKSKQTKDPKLGRSCSFDPSDRRGRRDTYTSSTEDLSASIDSVREDVESDDQSTHSDTIAKASSELAKDLHALASSVDLHGQEVTVGHVELKTAELIDSMFQTSTLKSAFKAPKSHSPSSILTVTPPNGRSNDRIHSAPPSARSSQEIQVTRSHHFNMDAYFSVSYDTLMVSSIHQLSHKLKESTDRVLHKLKEFEQISRSPSPPEDMLGDTTSSDLPAWKAANQDLAYILKNLRTVEHHVSVIDTTLFPEAATERSSAVDISSSTSNHELRKKVNKITEEIAAFKPIENPSRSSSWSSSKQKSFDSEQGDFNGEEYF